MKLLTLKLVNFRNLANVQINLGLKNFLIGDNAQGKTNILEAIYLLSTGKSFKFKQDPWLIKTGELISRVDGEIEYSNQDKFYPTIVLERDGLGVKKFLRLNNQPSQRRDFLNKVLTVLFTPDEVNLLRLYPAARRLWLNRLLAKAELTYFDDLINYHQALKQRNQLLGLIKRGQKPTSELDVWDEQLAELGSRIVSRRQLLMSNFTLLADNFFSQLNTQHKQIKLVYKTKLGIHQKEAYLKILQQQHPEDIIYGHTQTGPHRDDLLMLINNQDSRQMASQGEFRLMVIAMKLAEGAYLESIWREPPIYLMDDVFSELDNNIIAKVTSAIAGYQTIFTTTQRDIAAAQDRILIVDAGSVREEANVLA